MSHRYTEKQALENGYILPKKDVPTKEVSPENTKLQKANNTADNVILFFKSGVLKLLFGFLFVAVGAVSIVGLVDAVKVTPQNHDALLYFSIAMPTFFLIGVGLFLWYYFVNVKKKVYEKAKEDLEKINAAQEKHK